MENLPILNVVLPPRAGNVNGTASATDAAAADSGENGGFDAALQRELARDDTAAAPATPGKDATAKPAEGGDAAADAQQAAIEIGDFVATLVAPPVIPAAQPASPPALPHAGGPFQAIATAPAAVATARLATLPANDDGQSRPVAANDGRLLPAAANDGRILPAASGGGALAANVEANSAVNGKNWSAPTAANDPASRAATPGVGGAAETARLQAAHGLASAQSPASGPAAPNEAPMTTPAFSAAHSAAIEAAASRDMKLAPQVGAPGWDGALAQKVVWLVGERQQTAQLHLNPPQLGPLEVRVSVTPADQNAVANAQFASPHAAVREALEAAMPRLREILAESGITLGNATVGNGSFQQQGFASGDGPSPSWRADEHGGTFFRTESAIAVVRRTNDGTVDVFA
ncbi:MAG: flagellar hook-length control protein FliK [Burkholderiales bacterium]